MQQAQVRRTRQASIGRFRLERMQARASNLEERQRMLLAVAERVSQLVSEAQSDLSTMHADRAAMGRALRQELGDFAATLSKETVDRLSTYLSDRAARASQHREDMTRFMTELRADVVRIVSEDFH